MFNSSDGAPYDDRPPLMGETTHDPLEQVKAAISEQRGNLIYRTVELHAGPFARTIARFCEVYRHVSQDYRHTSVEFFHYRRQNQREGFDLVRKFALDGAALETFIASVGALPHLETIRQAASSIVLPVTGPTSHLGEGEIETVISGLSRFLNMKQGLRAIAEGKLTPETLDNIDAAAQQARYRRAASELRAMMEDPALDEQNFQVWFESHPWVFGTEYLRRIQARDIDIESKVDIVLLSADGYVDVFELKKPTETVLVGPSRHTYYAAAPVSQALSQAMHYLRLINENRLRLEEAWGKLVFRPRAIVVIGRSNNWNDGQRQAWRNLRTSLQNVDLLTFDHVLARANRLVAHYALPS
jgi:Domain of unknown function (DUF4263)